MPIKTKTEYLLFPDGNRAYLMNRTWGTQPKPYRHSLGFQFEEQDITGSYTDGTGTTYYDCSIAGPTRNGQADYTTLAINGAYDKLVSQLGNQSQMANNLIEGHQSISMASERLLQIGRFASALRKGNLGDAAKALASPSNPKPKLKGKAKDFAGQFLEGHFGWVPLIQDVYNAMNTLQKPNFDSQSVVGHKTIHDRVDLRSEYRGGGYHSFGSASQTNVFSCKMRARIRISNPNAYLANQLGLVNPASIAWEAVPYSFVADWFGNVGQVLNSMSDFVGIDVLDAYTTTSTECHISESLANVDAPYPSLIGSGSWKMHDIRVARSVGIIGPSLALKPFKGFSVTRGVTAISLLLQKL